MLCWFNQHVFRSISIACNQITITYIDISWERSFKDDLLLWQTKALLVPSHIFHTQTLGCIAKAELSCSERSCYEGRWRLPSPLFFFSKMMTFPQRAGSFLSRAVGPGTSSKTISLSANTSLPQYILLFLHSERLCCGNRRPRQNGWSSVTHSALDGEDSMLWDGDNLFQEASKCLGPGRCTAGESACQAKHWPPAGKHLSYSGSIQNWSRPNCMYNVGCWAVKTGCLSDQCWERDMICQHPLKAYYGKGQRALKRLSNEGCLCAVNGFHPARLQTRCI